MVTNPSFSSLHAGLDYPYKMREPQRHFLIEVGAQV